MSSITIQTLGCKVNQVESEQIAGDLAATFSVSGDEPCAVVINTCAVTTEAEAKTRKAIRRAASDPNVLAVVVTGCAATVSGPALEALDPKVIVVTDKHAVARSVAEYLATRGIELAEGTGLPEHVRTRRAVKIQDGCENFCTYCIVPFARGAGRSTPLSEVVDHVRELVVQGVGEVVLTGINIGKYRDELTGGDLPGLVRALKATGLHRLRLSSIEPPDVTDELLTALSEGGFGCEHLHIPLQAGCDETLRAMGRRYTVAEFESAVARVRGVWPQAAITTDVIVGFPSESDADFERSLATCERVGFSKVHVFRYSPRSGTPAAEMSQVGPEIVAVRSIRMRDLASRMADLFASTFLGHDVEVVVERIVGQDAHVTSREYLSFTVSADEIRAAGATGEGAVVRLAFTGARAGTVGLE